MRTILRFINLFFFSRQANFFGQFNGKAPIDKLLKFSFHTHIPFRQLLFSLRKTSECVLII